MSLVDGRYDIEQLRSRRRGHPLGVEHLVADFARPRLVEGTHRRKHGGNTKHAARNLLRKYPARVK